jgi:hypothetical protein
MIEIRTRKDFLDIADAIDVCKFKDADISFREACFTLKSKVNKFIRERMNDVFKIDENKYKEYEKAKFEYAKKFAVKDNEGNVKYNNEEKTAFSFDSKFSKEEIEKDFENWEKENNWKDFLNEIKRINKEKEEWLNKKIKLDLKKVDSIGKIPVIIGSYNEKATINDNLIYTYLVNLLCTEKVEDNSEDGVEVE